MGMPAAPPIRPDPARRYTVEEVLSWPSDGNRYEVVHGERRLRLAVEVISPSSARGDRLVKRRAYQEAGVETYWVVDPDHAVVEVWHPGDEIAEIVTRELVWRVTPEAAELRVPLAELFARLP